MHRSNCNYNTKQHFCVCLETLILPYYFWPPFNGYFSEFTPGYASLLRIVGAKDVIQLRLLSIIRLSGTGTRFQSLAPVTLFQNR